MSDHIVEITALVALTQYYSRRVKFGTDPAGIEARSGLPLHVLQLIGSALAIQSCDDYGSRSCRVLMETLRQL